MTTRMSPPASKRAPPELLIDVTQLVMAHHAEQPDSSVFAQRVAFGTSGHRKSAFDVSFSEWHVLAITQALCDQRLASALSGPLFMSVDTHAQSAQVAASALEVLAANGVGVMLAPRNEPTPAPAVSHAIVKHNRSGRQGGRTDGIVVTPHHNPPCDDGFKYNPPHGEAMVSTQLIDHVAAQLGRKLFKVPVGFNWFATGLDASLCFAGEERAGASFLRRDGALWTADKDGITAALPVPEITAVTGRDRGVHMPIWPGSSAALWLSWSRLRPHRSRRCAWPRSRRSSSCLPNWLGR